MLYRPLDQYVFTGYAFSLPAARHAVIALLIERVTLALLA